MTTQVWKCVSSLWVGGDLTWLEKLCLSSFTRKGYEVRLYSYAAVDVPSGINVHDASEIVPESQVFRNPAPSTSYAGFSNVFRYELLAKRPDEVWIDTDVLAGEVQLPADDYLLAYESRNYVNGAVLRCPQDSLLLKALRHEAQSIDRSTFVWGDLGPKLITNQIRKLHLTHVVSPQVLFYPISSLQVWQLFSPKLTETIRANVRESAAIHVWNEAFKLAGEDVKSFSPHPASYLGTKVRELELDTSAMGPVMPEELLSRWAAKSKIQSFRNRLATLVRN